jgi:hypothetical protein
MLRVTGAPSTVVSQTGNKSALSRRDIYINVSREYAQVQAHSWRPVMVNVVAEVFNFLAEH